MQVTQTSYIKRRLLAKAAAAAVPINGAFELTPRCNFACKMCYVRMTPETMKPFGSEKTAAEWLDLARQAKEAGMAFLLLTGGEPLLRQDFPEIYRGVSEMGLSVSINSNGALVTDEIRELFVSLPPANINVTLYGTRPESYGALCGNSNAYDQVVDNVRWMTDRNILVNLNATITPWNKEQMAQIQRFADEQNLNLRLTTYNFPPIRREEGAVNSRLSPEEAGILRAVNVLQQGGVPSVRELAGKISSEDLAQESIRELECGDPMHCYAGRAQFWITWNGKMTPCGMLNGPAVDPFALGFRQAWEQVRNATLKIRLCPDCVSCPERNTCVSCAAVTSSETGSFEGKPEYVCAMNRAFRNKILELAKDSE